MGIAIGIVGGVLVSVPIILAEIFGIVVGVFAFLGSIGAFTWLTSGHFPY